MNELRPVFCEVVASNEQEPDADRRLPKIMARNDPELYDDLLEVLDDYETELTDVLDHIKDEEEIDSYTLRLQRVRSLTRRLAAEFSGQRGTLQCILRVSNTHGSPIAAGSKLRQLLSHIEVPVDLPVNTRCTNEGLFDVCLTPSEIDDLTEEEVSLADGRYNVEVIGWS